MRTLHMTGSAISPGFQKGLNALALTSDSHSSLNCHLRQLDFAIQYIKAHEETYHLQPHTFTSDLLNIQPHHHHHSPSHPQVWQTVGLQGVGKNLGKNLPPVTP